MGTAVIQIHANVTQAINLTQRIIVYLSAKSLANTDTVSATTYVLA